MVTGVTLRHIVQIGANVNVEASVQRPLTMYFFLRCEPFGKRLNQTVLNIIHRVPSRHTSPIQNDRCSELDVVCFGWTQFETELASCYHKNMPRNIMAEPQQKITRTTTTMRTTRITKTTRTTTTTTTTTTKQQQQQQTQ